MRLIKSNKPQISECREIPGLLSCRTEYEVKSAQGRLDYAGPKFAPEVWRQVMSFFRWTNQEMQSESQVRLYVNHRLGRWGAWAFPQAARTGMNARELPVPETPEQARERFASWDAQPSDDWIYFGTAHHHCAASAFQSATDEQNEWNQDGLHLTVGRMDVEQHDLHARLYLGGNCFEPDLSLFWPIAPDLAAQVPTGLHHELARFQMCRKVTVDFPDAWRTNLVEVAREPQSLVSELHRGSDLGELGIPLDFRLADALEEISQHCLAGSVGEEQWMAVLRDLTATEASQIIVEACLKHSVTPEELLGEMPHFAFEY